MPPNYSVKTFLITQQTMLSKYLRPHGRAMKDPRHVDNHLQVLSRDLNILLLNIFQSYRLYKNTYVCVHDHALHPFIHHSWDNLHWYKRKNIKRIFYIILTIVYTLK